MRYENLQQALEQFSLYGKCSLEQIKLRHKQLVKEHHPDKSGSDNQRIREINAAYALLLEYCSHYRFTFSRDEFLRQYPEERLREQFADDPVWGGGKNS